MAPLQHFPAFRTSSDIELERFGTPPDHRVDEF
jgi:hypothetical protein